MEQKQQSVTKLIDNFKIITKLQHNQRITDSCQCLFRLYTHFDTFHAEFMCPIHGTPNKTTRSILHYLHNKNILYVTLQNYEEFLYEPCMLFMLPLVLNLYTNLDGSSCNFIEKYTPIRLSHSAIQYTSLFIINFITTTKTMNYFNHLLTEDKIILFKYIIFLNSKKKYNEYIECRENNFIFKIGRLIEHVPNRQIS